MAKADSTPCNVSPASESSRMGSQRVTSRVQRSAVSVRIHLGHRLRRGLSRVDGVAAVLGGDSLDRELSVPEGRHLLEDTVARLAGTGQGGEVVKADAFAGIVCGRVSPPPGARAAFRPR